MEKDPRTYAIIGAAMAVHRILGPGFAEPVFQEALGLEFRRRAIPAVAEVPLPVWYDGIRLKQSYRMDFVCHDAIAVELKAISFFGDREVAQLANYLCATRLPLGLILNFGSTDLQSSASSAGTVSQGPCCRTPLPEQRPESICAILEACTQQSQKWFCAICVWPAWPNSITRVDVAATVPARPKPSSKAKGAKATKTTDPFDPDFVGKLLPYLRALRGYTRLKADGLQHVPKRGPAILAANHTGWLGLDYALAALIVHDERDRTPRGLVHSAWFVAPATAQFAGKVGLSKVSKEAMAKALRAGHLVMVFPEGEKGAFRPGSDYKLTEFARGFVRVAMAERVPIIPVAILGGEESNPVERTIKSYEQLLKMQIPVPTNILPKPVKWRIRFLPPLKFPKSEPSEADDTTKVHAVAEDVQLRVQTALDTLKVERGHPYI